MRRDLDAIVEERNRRRVNRRTWTKPLSCEGTSSTGRPPAVVVWDGLGTDKENWTFTRAFRTDLGMGGCSNGECVAQ